MVLPVVASAAAPAVGAAISGIGSYFSGKSAQEAAMYNYKHRYRWQVEDMKKAGINPMLAFSQGAPNVPQASMPDIGQAISRGAEAGSAVRQSAVMLEAQKDNVLAQTQSALAVADNQNAAAHKSDVETRLLEAQLPYSSKNAEVQSLTIDRQFQVLGRQLEKLGYEVGSSKLGLQQQELSAPVELELKQLERDIRAVMLQAEKLGIPEKQAAAKLWDTVGATGKGADLLRKLIPGIGNINIGGTKNVVLPQKR